MKNFDSLSKSYFLYFIILVGLVVFRILSSLGLFNFFGDMAEYVFTFVVQIILLFGLSVFAFAKLNKKSIKEVLNSYNFKKISKKSIFICILIGFVVYFLNSYIASFFLFFLSLMGYTPYFSSSGMTNYPIWLLIVNIFFTAVLPAVCEETVHRGMLLTELKKRNLFKAIIISSLLFGLLHINIYQFFYATILGFLLAILTLKTNSIFPAMVIHFMNNALNVYMSYSSTNNLPLAKFINSIFTLAGSSSIYGVVFFILFFVFLIMCLKILYQELCRETAKKNIANLQEKLSVFLTKKIYFDEIEKVRNDEPIEEEKTIELSIINDFINKNTEKSEKNHQKHSKFAKLFLIASVFLSAISTIFTLIWGII